MQRSKLFTPHHISACHHLAQLATQKSTCFVVQERPSKLDCLQEVSDLVRLDSITGKLLPTVDMTCAWLIA